MPFDELVSRILADEKPVAKRVIALHRKSNDGDVVTLIEISVKEKSLLV